MQARKFASVAFTLAALFRIGSEYQVIKSLQGLGKKFEFLRILMRLLRFLKNVFKMVLKCLKLFSKFWRKLENLQNLEIGACSGLCWRSPDLKSLLTT